MVKMPNYSPEAPIQDGGIGGVGNAFVVSNYSQVRTRRSTFIKFLMSKEEQTLKAESGEGRLLNVTDVDTAKYYRSDEADPTGVGEPSRARSSGSTISYRRI